MRYTKLSAISGVKPAGSILLQRLTAIAFASLFFWGAVAKAQDREDDTQAGQQCTEQTLTGGYGYSFSGFIGPFTGTPTPSFFGVGRVGAVGLATFNGAGSLTARDTLARSGTPAIRHAGTGTYGVNADCTGHASIDLTSDPNSTPVDFEHLEFDFMIVPGAHGREFSFIITHQTLCTVGEACTPTLPEQTGVALSVGEEACSDASLQGTYRVLSTGTNLVNPSKPVANANVGFRTLDGAGLITDGEDTQFANGVLVPPTGRTGTYRVESDCTVTNIRNDGTTFDGVVVAGGREVHWLRTGNKAITNSFYKKGSGRIVMGTRHVTARGDTRGGGDND
jgi:hypothetical protein